MARFFLLCSLLLFVSCCRLPTLPITGNFDGVEQALSEGNVVSVVMTHGMGGYSDGDPHDLINTLVDQLGLIPDGDPLTRAVHSEENNREYGCLERKDFYNPTQGWQVRFYLLDWRRSTWSEKSVLRDLDDAAALSCLQAPFNDKWRKQLLNDVVADVALYLGKHSKQIRYPFKQAVRWIEEDAADCPNHDIMVITFSLGCVVMFDALCEMNHCEDPATKSARDWFVHNTRSFFMMSNQLPLIEINRMHPWNTSFAYNDESPPFWCESCMTHNALEVETEPRGIHWNNTPLGDFFHTKKEQDPSFRVVNFTDPNDLLSYIVFTGAVPHCTCGATSDEMIQNVLVRNAKRAWFGKLANPAKAHQDYGENPQVLGLIIDGLQSRCKPGL